MGLIFTGTQHLFEELIKFYSDPKPLIHYTKHLKTTLKEIELLYKRNGLFLISDYVDRVGIPVDDALCWKHCRLVPIPMKFRLQTVCCLKV